MYCSSDIINASSCYIDNWDKIFGLVLIIIPLAIFFGIVVGIIKKAIN